MPVLLILAAFTSLHFKYLLTIPAQAAFAGTLVAAWLAWKAGRRFELWGWLLIALSMAGGLLMGLFAFDGPLPDPEFLGGYNDFGRRLTRLTHAYAVVLGLVTVFLARALASQNLARWRVRANLALFVAGTVCTLVVLPLAAHPALPLQALGVGPALVAAGLAFSIVFAA